MTNISYICSKNYKTMSELFKQKKIRDLRRGQLFRIWQFRSRVYVRGRYNRNLRSYTCPSRFYPHYDYNFPGDLLVYLIN